MEHMISKIERLVGLLSICHPILRLICVENNVIRYHLYVSEIFSGVPVVRINNHMFLSFVLGVFVFWYVSILKLQLSSDVSSGASSNVFPPPAKVNLTRPPGKIDHSLWFLLKPSSYVSTKIPIFLRHSYNWKI
ncbi:hypothetical protein L6452_17255 [Arctium lappa]|uniref:Uncharacterized protein n=1 Tax=Arctium lappa TaxID=4217 RepID=A0ACB9C2U4_ARCLA|nr:hypothetical protein L6452_17255 [Arctium lappa]